MEVIVGTIIMHNNKILMVKEAKEECYGKWAFPAGHLENNESIFNAAKRETNEETGYKVQLKKVFPIITNKNGIVMIYFFAESIENSFKYNTNEIIEIKWIEISKIKQMKENEFRSFEVIKFIIESLEKNKLYDIDIIKELDALHKAENIV